MNNDCSHCCHLICSQCCFTFTLTGHVETCGNDAPLKDREHLSWFLCNPLYYKTKSKSFFRSPQSISPISCRPLIHNQAPRWAGCSPNWTRGGFNGGPTGLPSSPASCARSRWSPCWRAQAALGLTALNSPGSLHRGPRVSGSGKLCRHWHVCGVWTGG